MKTERARDMQNEPSPADKALAKLDEWERHIEAMSPVDQLLIAIAKGAFARFIEEHGMPGQCAVQIALLAQVVISADPTILQ